jgi:hypothetical protein
MLKIIEAEATATPSRQWAEAAWRANPRIAPNWWRENLGFTHSKVVLDAREAPSTALPEGVNVVLTAGAPGAWAAGVICVAVTPNPTAAQAQVVLWQVPDQVTPQEATEQLLRLEQRVSSGEIEAYGVADDTLGTAAQRWGLNTWLSLAATAAEAVWGRKKRPALKALLVPFDGVASAPLLLPSTELKGQSVPLLEQAAHLNIWVLAHPMGLKPVMAPAEVLQALTDLAQAEVQLHVGLKGQWPHIMGQPVFSVLQPLQHGQAPWPHPCMVKPWQNLAWPALTQAFHTYGTTPAGAAWVAAWQRVYPLMTTLAHAASRTTVEALMHQRLGHALPVTAGLDVTHSHIHLLGSVPGIGGVVVPIGCDVQALLSVPDIADVGGFFSAA